MTLRKCDDRATLKKLRRLYKSAFPRNERAPFFMMNNHAKKGRGEMLAAEENGVFAGLVYLVGYKDLIYLWYLAVSEDMRGQGCGGRILKALKEQYPGRRIFLAREQLDESADNYRQRVDRHGFYLKNGFSDLNSTIKEGKVTFDVMGINGEVKPEEYDALMSAWLGKRLRRFADMKLTPSER